MEKTNFQWMLAITFFRLLAIRRSLRIKGIRRQRVKGQEDKEMKKNMPIKSY